MFRLDRIEGAVALGEPGSFERPDEPGDGPAEPWEFGDDEPVLARLLVDGEHAVWAEQALGRDAAVEERPDGAVVFEVAVSHWPAFRSFVAAFLEHAEVLGPPSLRADMITWLEAIRDTGPAEVGGAR